MSSRTNKIGIRRVKAAKAVSGALLRMQRSWANMMGRYINGLSLPMRKIGFGIWCILSAVPCCMLLLAPFAGKREPAVIKAAPRLAPILPPQPAPAGGGRQELDMAVRRFNQFRDSLKVKGGADWDRFRRMYGLKNNDTSKINTR